MNSNCKVRRKTSWLYLPLMLLAGFVLVVGGLLVFYRPDRPEAIIVPGSSSEPTFAVQIVRPRMGLPMGGILPPQFFGLDSSLRFDSQSEGAAVRNVGAGRIELAADGWDLRIVLDDDGQVTSETEVVFHLVFEDQVRRVRCRPGDPVVGSLDNLTLDASGDMSGSFDIELARCEDADTGEPLGWPPQPFILHGSFDRLPLDNDAEER